MKRYLAGLMALLLVSACIKPTRDEAFIKELQEEISGLEKELATYEEKIRSAPDAGKVYELINARDLLKSRIERLRAKSQKQVFK